MLPVVVLVGQPNVGKSTLFNRLTKSRDALVGETPGLTRDRQYGIATINNKKFIAVDTAGIDERPAESAARSKKNMTISRRAMQQSLMAMQEADVIIFMVDGKLGLNSADYDLAQTVRELAKPVWLAVNKTEGQDTDVVMSDAFSLGMEKQVAISASHGHGLSDLFENALATFPEQVHEESGEGIPRIAVIGRPNVGKSTLINALLKEERMVVFDQPGTTRDSVEVDFRYNDHDYILIDTAGVRRRSKVERGVEQFSVVQSLQALNSANVIIMIMDAKEGITDQDVTLAGHVLEHGKSIVIVINKIDLLNREGKEHLLSEIDRRLPFMNYAAVLLLSAKKGTRLKQLIPKVDRAYESAFNDLKTSRLNNVLEKAIIATPPPVVRGRRIKLKFAHQGGKNPPTIIIHGNQTKAIPDSYQRYLANSFRKAFDLEGTPVRLVFKQGKNPFEGRKQAPTQRQKKRQRRQKHRMKKKYT
jgi:GTP-binding protein